VPNGNVNPPVVPSMSTSPADTFVPTQHKKVGPIVAILVIVLVLVMAALYLFASRLNTNAPATSVVSNTITTAPAATETANVNQLVTPTPSVAPITNTADDPQSLSNDLNSATQGLDNQSF